MNQKFKKRMTAAEALAVLRNDPEWVAARAEEETQRQQRAAALRRAELPLIQDLCAAGVHVGSVWDLVNTSTPYPEALPILAEHLNRAYPAKVREGIGRAMAVRDARFAWNELVAHFRNEGEKVARDGMAVALAAIADDSVIDDLIKLAQEEQHGSSRKLLLQALARSKKLAAHEALLKLEADPQLQAEVKNLLRRAKRRTRPQS